MLEPAFLMFDKNEYLGSNIEHRALITNINILSLFFKLFFQPHSLII